MECLELRVQDIDFARNEILVRDGKGAKDRFPVAILHIQRKSSCGLQRMRNASIILIMI